MNPWAALMDPIRSRPGDALRKPPALPASAHSADGYTVRAAAALVITYTGVHDRPNVRLLPIIALEFSA